MDQQTYTKKVWIRYFGIIFIIFLIIYIFPSTGKMMPMFLGSFTSSYFITAIPSMRPTFRDKCCAAVGGLFFITSGYLLIEYVLPYIPWFKEAQVVSTMDFLILMFVMLSFIIITFLTGYIIALYLSIIFFGRGEIGDMTIKEYMLKNLTKRSSR